MDVIFVDGGDGPSLHIENGIIRSVGPGITCPPEAIRLQGGVARPGAVNAHTHLYSGLVPLGMPPPAEPPEDFVQILQRVWWRLDRALDAGSLSAAAHLYVAEALLSGTTALVDHHESPAFIEGSLDILADAAETLGCRLVTCYGATDRNMGEMEGARGLAECARFLKHNERSLVRGMVGLHAPFTVTDDTVRAAGELTRELGVPLHVHVAEDLADVHDAEAHGHDGPLERLLSLGALPPGSILAHGVHLTEAQVERAEQDELWLVQNPRSNAGNRVGYPHALRVSHRVALGTDGYAADMRAEGAALEEQSRVNGQPITAERLAERLDGGHRIVGERFGQRFGSKLEPGMAADVVVWDSDADAETPGTVARHVIVAGRVVVEDGRLKSGDLAQIRAHARDEAPRLWSRMERY